MNVKLFLLLWKSFGEKQCCELWQPRQCTMSPLFCSPSWASAAHPAPEARLCPRDTGQAQGHGTPCQLGACKGWHVPQHPGDVVLGTAPHHLHRFSSPGSHMSHFGFFFSYLFAALGQSCSPVRFNNVIHSHLVSVIIVFILQSSLRDLYYYLLVFLLMAFGKFSVFCHWWSQ